MKKKVFFAAALAFLVVAGLSSTPASAQSSYEVWSCGEFNVQGYMGQQTIQFYPFLHKIGDLYKLTVGRTYLLLLNPGAGGNYFAYLVQREDGAPVYWIYFNNNWQVVNSDELFPSCSYSAE